MSKEQISRYMNLPYRIEIVPDADEGGFSVNFPELPGCITCADTIEEAIRLAQDAKKEWIISELEEGHEIPLPVDNSYSGQFKLRIPKTLHRQLAELAKAEGISMNQYCLYLLSMNNALHVSKR